MNLYYVHPHWMFEHPDFNLDSEHAFFIIAATPRDALELWIHHHNTIYGDAMVTKPLAYSHQIDSADIKAIVAGAASPVLAREIKRCIEVRDLTFDLHYAMSQMVPWEELQPQSFVLKEF